MSPEPVPDTASDVARPRLQAVRDNHPTDLEKDHPRPFERAISARFRDTGPDPLSAAAVDALFTDRSDRSRYTAATEAGGRNLTDVEALAAANLARVRAELPTRDPAVFACYLGGLALALEPTSEADPIGILACLLAAVSVRIGPGPHIRAGDDRHPLLIWSMLVGRTMMGKKGSAWSAALRLITAADTEFAAHNIHSGLTSGEGLAALFADDTEPTSTTGTGQSEKTKDAAPPRTLSGRHSAPQPRARLLPTGDYRLLDVEPEWGAVMSRMRREGNSLSATLRAAWEGGNLSTLTVTARMARISHIGVLAHISPDEFRAKVKDSDLAGGTYNRFLPVFVACSKFLPGSTGAPDDLVARLGADLATRLDKAGTRGLIELAPEASDTWRGLYLEFGSQDESGPVVQFTARAVSHCLRIAALYAALDGTDITTSHLHAAAALVRYSIDSARAVFTRGDLDRVAVFITDAGPAGRTKTEITNGLFGKNAKPGRVDTALAALVSSGRIVRARRPTGGRPVEVYTANPTEETE